MNLDEITVQNKEKLVKNIGVMYRDSLCLVKNDAFSSVSEKEGVYHCLTLKTKVDHILKGLRLEYAFIIQKEYLEENKGKWYATYLSEEEYQLYKNGAIDAFLHCLYG
ncbi:MAG: hypothetical protein EOM50_00215 [Erysipelotrichia bacterium]|nr:hypothetical protein [Erysipelotrichia bacterium]NCC55002.1 hypothetical protein [Erysipelotrichia bacterium]